MQNIIDRHETMRGARLSGMRLVSIRRDKQKRRSSPTQHIDHADHWADDHDDATQRGRLHPTGQVPAGRSADQSSDFFFTTLRQDGLYQWWYFYYIPSPYSMRQYKIGSRWNAT